jgi:hypothetical protein
MMDIDLEREYLTDIIYLMEKQKQIEDEYWEWESRKPAIINVIIEKKENENHPEQITTTL